MAVLATAVISGASGVAGVSYVRALVYPGQATFAERSVDWLRDHGGAPIVNAAENWWFTRHPPGNTPLQPKLPHADSAAPQASPPAALPALSRAASPPGALPEGHWQVGASARDGTPLMHTTYLRPDPEHASVTAAIARFDQRQVRIQLIAGTKEPISGSLPGRGAVPDALRAGLVATFNSGFKLRDTHDGYVADHHAERPLRDGEASFMIDDSGRGTIERWNRGAQLRPNIVAVRQNLALILDDGKPVPGLEVNTDQRWGNARNQLQYTWRSAAGVDAAGNLYYVAGDQLTLTTLARALAATGAQRGMELDIHPNTVHLFAYQHSATGEPIPIKLLGSMRGPVDRYLIADQRDFFAVTSR